MFKKLIYNINGKDRSVLSGKLGYYDQDTINKLAVRHKVICCNVYLSQIHQYRFFICLHKDLGHLRLVR